MKTAWVIRNSKPISDESSPYKGIVFPYVTQGCVPVCTFDPWNDPVVGFETDEHVQATPGMIVVEHYPARDQFYVITSESGALLVPITVMVRNATVVFSIDEKSASQQLVIDATK